ncbi:ABC transporter permease [Gammaproteobacteria bacterium]|nr:ABC transporter permease [Gammaproteobacteria bacterium]
MTYIRNRILRLIPVFFLVTFASFALLNILPGDVADAMLGGADADDTSEDILEARLEIRKELGLDRPIIVRYFSWLSNVMQGDFGESQIQIVPVWELIVERIPVTLELLILSQILALIIAVPAGIYSALKADKTADRLIATVAFGIVAMPPFIMAILFVFVFAVALQLLPASGYIPIEEGLYQNLLHYILPATTIGLLEVPILLRVLRVDLIATLQEDYIAMAKAKGLSRTYILFNHALRPSSFSLVTVLGLQFGFLISGTVIIEQMFGLPGIGKLVLEAIDNRDAMLLQGAVTMIALAYVAINLIVDLLYGLIDPRVGEGGQGIDG